MADTIFNFRIINVAILSIDTMVTPASLSTAGTFGFTAHGRGNPVYFEREINFTTELKYRSFFTSLFSITHAAKEF